jgi:hypothetical protein
MLNSRALRSEIRPVKADSTRRCAWSVRWHSQREKPGFQHAKSPLRALCRRPEGSDTPSQATALAFTLPVLSASVCTEPDVNVGNGHLDLLMPPSPVPPLVAGGLRTEPSQYLDSPKTRLAIVRPIAGNSSRHIPPRTKSRRVDDSCPRLRDARLQCGTVQTRVGVTPIYRGAILLQSSGPWG